MIVHINGNAPEVIELPCAHELVYEVEHIKECVDVGKLTSPTITKDLSVKGIAALELVKSAW